MRTDPHPAPAPTDPDPTTTTTATDDERRGRGGGRGAEVSSYDISLEKQEVVVHTTLDYDTVHAKIGRASCRERV